MQKRLTNYWFYPLLVWLLGTLFYSYEFFQRAVPSDLATDLMKYFSVQAAGLSIIASSYYWAYVAMQLPAGVLVDRYGPKRLLLAAIALVAIGTFWFTTTHSILFATLARILVGLGSAFAFVCSLRLIANWFAPNRFAIYAGGTQFLGYMGAAAAGAPLGYFVLHFGWQQSLMATAIYGFILLGLVWLVVRDHPAGKTPIISSTKEPILSGLKAVIKKPQNWINGIYACTMMGPTSVFAALWGVPYLVNVDNINYELATGAVSMIFFGVAIGSPVFGWISDYFQLRRAPLIFASIGAIIVTTSILYVFGLPIWILYSLCFLFGFFQSAHVLNFAIAHEINRPGVCGAAIGFTNMVTVAGGAIFQPLVGLLLRLEWDGKIVSGVAQYTATNYHWSLLVLPIIQVIGLLIAIFLLRETHCKPKHERTIIKGPSQW